MSKELDKLRYDILDALNEKFEDYAFGRNKDNFVFVNGVLTEKQLTFSSEVILVDGDRKEFIKGYVEDLLTYFYKNKFMKKVKACPKTNE